MLGLSVILMVICACAAMDARDPPPYVQSRAAYQNAKLYLKTNIPRDNGDITNPKTRRHFGYGHIAAVCLALVEAYNNNSHTYDPIAVLDKTMPKAWLHYNLLASGPINSLLAEAQAGIQPVTTLIDLMCGPDSSVDECNILVDKKIQSGSMFLKKRAKFLIQLGIVSKVIQKNMANLDFITAKDLDIPYLIQNVEKRDFTRFIIDLNKTINVLRDQGLRTL